MSQLMNFVTPLHRATKRDYLARMVDDKVGCMHKAKEYEQDYWDGDRRYGYGGYKYLPGRWKPVAEALIANYGLKAGSRILDVGCGKGFLLYEMQLIEPGLDIGIKQTVGICVVTFLEQVLAEDARSLRSAKLSLIRREDLVARVQLLLVFVNQSEFDHTVSVVRLGSNGALEEIDFERLE